MWRLNLQLFLIFSMIILAINLLLIIYNFYLWKINLIYVALYEALLDDIRLIDIPSIVFENLDFLVFIFINTPFLFLVNFVLKLRLEINKSIVKRENYINPYVFSKSLKVRAPPEI